MEKDKLIVGMFMGLLFLCSCGGRETAEKEVANVRLFTVENFDGMSVQDFPGQVVAAEEVNLAFKVGGTLMHVYAEEGEKVVKGELVAEMDARDYQVQLDATEAEYMRIKSEAERVMALYADSVSTADAYDKARYGLKQIAAKYENARNQLADTKIYAPFNGYVQKKLFDPPTVVAAGMPVMTLVSGDRPEIEINIPSSTYVRRNEIATFSTSFDFISKFAIPLHLISIAPAANANQLYTVRLAVPAEVFPLPSPGMNAMVKVAFRDTVGGNTLIPSSALFKKDNQSCVWVYDEKSGSVVRRVVSVERLDINGCAIVTQGISVGERIVVAGVHKLNDGQKVKPLSSESKTNIGGLL